MNRNSKLAGKKCNQYRSSAGRLT